jgi:GTP-binding protein
MDALTSLLPEYSEEKIEYPKIAVVGRPNVGKSTIINTLLGKKRMIVSPAPGTTRDSVDSICTYYGRRYVLIDTAGLRKKSRIRYPVERFSIVRAVRSIERCNVALIVLDATEGIVEQDQKVAGIVEDYGKGAMLLLNKWDLIDKPEEAYKKLSSELKRKMWFMPYAPVLTVSALVKKRITKVFPVIDEVITERKKRIRTSELNRFFDESLSRMPLAMYKGKAVKLYYITQIKTEPPVFVVFTNYPSALKDIHIRYIEKGLRGRFSFKGTPIRIYVRSRERDKDR